MEIIAKKLKGNKIVFNKATTGVREVQGYTLIKISEADMNQLIEACPNSVAQFGLDGSINLEVAEEDISGMTTIWNRFYREKNLKPNQATKKYKVQTPGTSLLIRDPKKGEIRIAYRRQSDTKQSINKVFIANGDRELFFRDAKLCSIFRDTKRYAIGKKDLFYYKKWAERMTKDFERGLGND